jgi:hypothetical protein
MESTHTSTTAFSKEDFFVVSLLLIQYCTAINIASTSAFRLSYCCYCLSTPYFFYLPRMINQGDWFIFTSGSDQQQSGDEQNPTVNGISEYEDDDRHLSTASLWSGTIPQEATNTLSEYLVVLVRKLPRQRRVYELSPESSRLRVGQTD